MLDQIQRRLQQVEPQNRERRVLPQNPQAQKVAALLQSVKTKGSK